MPESLPVLIHNTITDHLREVEDHRLRGRTFWAMLKSRGQFKYNCSGPKMDWRIKYKLAPATGYSDMETVSYAVHDKTVVAELGWRHFITTEAISAIQKMVNKGPQAIVKMVDEIVPDMSKRLADEHSEQFFGDGDASGSDLLWQGMEIFLAERTAPAASDLIAEPGDNYAGLDTNLGTKGGSWSDALTSQPNATLSNDWPYGTGEYEYDYYSPKLVNWSSTGWGTGLTTFRANGMYAMREAITWCQLTGGKDGKLDLILLNPQLYTAYKNSQDSRQVLNVQATSSPLWKMGFTDVMNLDGTDITSDYDVPGNTGYGMNFDEIEVRSLNEQLYWAPKLPYDSTRLADLFLMGAFGNFRFRSPKGFAKFDAYA